MQQSGNRPTDQTLGNSVSDHTNISYSCNTMQLLFLESSPPPLENPGFAPALININLVKLP